MRIESRAELAEVPSRYGELPPAYQEWIALLSGEAIRKRYGMEAAMEVSSHAGEYWYSSWFAWAASRPTNT